VRPDNASDEPRADSSPANYLPTPWRDFTQFAWGEHWRRRRLMRKAGRSSLACTHMWLMDDDCEPEPEGLASWCGGGRSGERSVLGATF